MKNLIISGVIGCLFMAGGFYFGMRLMPVPPPKAKTVAATAPGAPANSAAPAPDAISVDTLRKTSETMMALNQALQAREQNVAERERKVKEREDEIIAERQALDRTHERFKVLFNEFQDRLQLVESSQLEQLQKEAELYSSMGSDQSIDLIRAMDDPSMTRLFSVMDTKPLAKLMADWKAKHPEDGPRLLHALNGMASVLPKDKIALSDPPPDVTGSPSAPADSSAPTAAPESATPDAPAQPPVPAAAPTPSDANPPASAPDSSSASSPSLQPPADATSGPAPTLPAPPQPNPAPISTAATN